jgi:alpha-L-fucosidase
MRLLPVIMLLIICNVYANGQSYTPDWESLDKRPVPEWFQNSKFGIFIHWGVYSVPAWGPADLEVGDRKGLKFAEWYWSHLESGNPLFMEYHKKNYGEDFKYQDFVHDFKAENFDPDYWAKLFKDAGARYVVLTSKHHEGFTLWPSRQSWNWNSVDVGPHRDLAGDLSQAVKAAGLYMGFYYSLYEWFNPLYRENLEKYVDEHMIPQMKDLVETYRPDIIWPDGEWGHTSDKWKSEEFLAWLYNESPVKETVVVNDRWGKETRSVHGGFYTTEYGKVHEGLYLGDQAFRTWEEYRGIGTSFGYNRMENLNHYKTSEELVHLLISTVSKGGNLLLDVGPTADGRIPVIMQERLLDIGRWLKDNGDAVYGSRRTENITAGSNADCYFTRKGKDLFVILTQWRDDPLEVTGVSGAESVSLLGSNKKVSYSIEGNSLVIVPPAISPASSPWDYAWVFKITGVKK